MKKVRKDGWQDRLREAIDTSKTPAENTQGLVERAKGFAASVMTGVAEWVAGKVAEEVALMAAAAAASGGLSEVLDVLRRIYKAIKSAVRWARKILEMASRVLDTVLDIAKGAVETAGERFEAAMHLGMPVVIGFLAEQVGLGGVGKALREIVDKLRQKVDDAILWLIDKLKAGLQALAGAAKKAARAVLDWWHERFEFTTEAGEPHAVAVEGNGPDDARVMVRSGKPIALPSLVAQIADDDLRAKAETRVKEIDKLMKELKNLSQIEDTAKAKDLKAKLYKALSGVANILTAAGVLDSVPASQVKPDGKWLTNIPVRKSRWFPNEDLGGEVMEVDGLSYHYASGGSATGESRSPIWAAINANPKYQRRYVQGHLLNAQVGGPGTNVRNLTPITSSANGLHKNRAEADIKRLVLKQKHLLRYNVVANYPSSKGKEIYDELCTSLSVEWQRVRLPRDGTKFLPFGPVLRVEIPNARPD